MTNLKDCCISLAASGFGTVEMSAEMMCSFSRLLQEYPNVDDAMNIHYSFAEETDDFMAYGLEYAQDASRPDQCERFCYWQAHARNGETIRFWRRHPVDLTAAMNRKHTAFGNRPFTVPFVSAAMELADS